MLIIEEKENLFNAEAFKPILKETKEFTKFGCPKSQQYLLWNMDGPHHFRRQHLLLRGQQIFQEVDGDVVIRRQEHADVASQEVVDLPLAPILGSEFLG